MPGFTAYSDSLPKWLQEALKIQAERANALSRAPFVPYAPRGGRSRVAPISQDIIGAHNLTRQTLQNRIPEYNAFQQSLDDIGRSSYSNRREQHRFMSPYQEQVVQQLGREGSRNFSEDLLPALEARFVRLGQYGSSQHQRLANRALRDSQAEILKAQHKALAHGYEMGSELHRNELDRRTSAAKALNDLSRQRMSLGLLDAAALENLGQMRRGEDQATRDIEYETYLRQLNHPHEQLAREVAMTQGMPVSREHRSYSRAAPVERVNTMGQLGSLAGQLLAAGFGGRPVRQDMARGIF